MATFGKVIVEPNATNAVPSAVRAWLDARAPDEAAVEDTVTTIRSASDGFSQEHGVTLSVRQESFTPLVRFDQALRDRIAATLAAAGVKAPVLPTGAGHDAGVLAARVPTAMLFVRNPTGVSHSPAEHADLADCEAGVRALAAVLEDLAGPTDQASWLADLAWLPGQGVQRDVLIEADGDRFTSVTPAATAPAPPLPPLSPLQPLQHHAPPRPHASRLRQRPLARLPPRAALHHPGRPRYVLDLARAYVRRRGPPRPGQLPPAGPRRIRRDGAGRDQLRGGVPLPAPPAGRVPVRRPQRHGPGPDPGRGRRGPAHHAARHLLPDGRPGRRGTAAAGRTSAAVRRRRRGALGGARHRARLRRPRHDRAARPGRRGDPFGPRGAEGADAPGRGLGPSVRRPAARPHVRAARRERGVPGGVRDVARPAAVRAGRARPADHGRARHPRRRR